MSEQKNHGLLLHCKDGEDGKTKICTCDKQEWEDFQAKLKEPQENTITINRENYHVHHRINDDKNAIHGTLRTAIIGATTVGVAYLFRSRL